MHREYQKGVEDATLTLFPLSKGKVMWQGTLALTHPLRHILLPSLLQKPIWGLDVQAL